jgi:hypothetical protein
MRFEWRLSLQLCATIRQILGNSFDSGLGQRAASGLQHQPFFRPSYHASACDLDSF